MEPSQTPSSRTVQTPLKQQKGGWTTFPFSLGAVMGLSLAAGGWASNLIVFFTSEFNIKSVTAAQINNVVLGCNSLVPIAGAIIADSSSFGSFSVVLLFAFPSLMGMIILTIATTIHSLRPQPCAIGSSYPCETPSRLQYAMLCLALALASLGLGGTRFTITTMGADQFDGKNDQATFFNWCFFILYIANAINFAAIIYLQDNVSWGLVFGICAIPNPIGLVLFLFGKHFYRDVKPKGSPFISIVRVLVAAIRKRKISGESFQGQVYYHEDDSSAPSAPLSSPSQSFSQENGSYAKSWRLCTVEEVEDLKTLIKILPLWSTRILLSTTIAMAGSLTILEALTVDRHLGTHLKVPAGSFLVFNLLATALTIFIIDSLLLLSWQNLTHRSLTPLQRIGIGHIINILAMVSSALVESRRLHVVRAHHLYDKPGSVVPMSGLWLVLLLTIIGVGEGFHFPGQVALYYQEFPKSLRSTSTAMISFQAQNRGED